MWNSSLARFWRCSLVLDCLYDLLDAFQTWTAAFCAVPGVQDSLEARILSAQLRPATWSRSMLITAARSTSHLARRELRCLEAPTLHAVACPVLSVPELSSVLASHAGLSGRCQTLLLYTSLPAVAARSLLHGYPTTLKCRATLLFSHGNAVDLGLMLPFYRHARSRSGKDAIPIHSCVMPAAAVSPRSMLAQTPLACLACGKRPGPLPASLPRASATPI